MITNANDDTGARFRAAYWALVHNLDALRLRAWEDRGFTLPQLRILFYLRAHPGVTTHALAASMGLRVPTVSGLVDKLARGGLVERGRDPDDRRLIPLTLTDGGREAVGEIRQGNRAYLEDLAADLGDDLEETTRVLETLVARIERRPALAETGTGDPPNVAAGGGADTIAARPARHAAPAPERLRRTAGALV